MAVIASGALALDSSAHHAKMIRACEWEGGGFHQRLITFPSYSVAEGSESFGNCDVDPCSTYLKPDYAIA